jgi:hypothetical protein
LVGLDTLEMTSRERQCWRAISIASRLAVWIRPSVMSDAEEMVPTGGELTLFEAVGRLA